MVEKRKNLLINILYLSVILFIAYLGFKYFFVWILPFVLGFLLASLVNSLSIRISKNKNVNQKLCSLVIITVIYLAIFAFVALFSNELITEGQKRISDLPKTYENSIAPIIDSAMDWGKGAIERLSPSFNLKGAEMLSTVKESAENMIISFSGKAIDFFTGFVKKIPSFLLAMFFAVVSSVFIVWDYDKIVAFVNKQVSNKGRETISKIKHILFNSVFKLLKAYIILMIITFFELAAGFLILRVSQPIEKAILIALADFLPLIGVSAIFIPWIIILLFQKKFYLAIGLSILFLVITIIRNLIEPKIIGKQIGLSPLVSLMCFYIGLKLFGFWGVIILPIVVILIKTLNDEGIINLWKL